MKKMLLGSMLCLILASCATAGTVVVWGEALSGFSLSSINNFYNAVPGTTSSIAAGQLDTVNLTGVNLLWATQPADSYTGAELATMGTFLATGGRIAFMGEHGTFAPNQNLRINAALTALGATIQIVNDLVDGGFHDATVGNGQILANPLTVGVNTYNYAAFAELLPTGTAQTLMVGTNLSSVMMAYQNIGPGSIFLITDQNVWDNVGQVGTNDNHRMFENLLLGDTGAPPPPGEVPEPSTFAMLGLGAIAMGLARRRHNLNQ